MTTLSPKDLPTLKKALALPAEKLHTPAAGLAPEYETVELLSAQFPNLNLEQLLRKLDSEARLDGKYFLCNQRQLLETAQVLGTVSCRQHTLWRLVVWFMVVVLICILPEGHSSMLQW